MKFWNLTVNVKNSSRVSLEFSSSRIEIFFETFIVAGACGSIEINSKVGLSKIILSSLHFLPHILLYYVKYMYTLIKCGNLDKSTQLVMKVMK